jgi:dihydroorotate dehydrogenase
MLFISPPFGNYVKLPETKSIKGSFTLEPREGLLMQIMKTLRYSFEHGGWVNKIGLRNKGIDWAIKNHNNNNEICSIAILDEKEIPIINKKLPENMNIEINVSCPNAEKKMINIGIDTFLNNKRDYCIVKLSPKTDTQTIDTFYKQGFRQFHCSNTIPIKEGGLSGPKLIPYTSNLVSYIHNNYPDCEIIAGGGIQNYNDINYYKKLGANHTSVSTLLFNPFKFGLLYGNYITGKK